MEKQRLRLSVIIPMYQSEKFIAGCLESILAQQVGGLEVLCIDDGSTDGTCAVVSGYAERDARIRLARQPHGGVARARNAGIGMAGGDYLLFLDSDDMLRRGKLGKALRRAEREDADILVFGGKTNVPLETPFWIREAFSPGNRVYRAFHPAALLERGARPSAGNKLYKRQLVAGNGIKFDAGLPLAEDQAFQFYVFPHASKIVFYNCRLYLYRIHQQDSAMARSQRDSGMRVSSHFLAMEKIREDWERRGYWGNPAFRQVYCCCYVGLLFEELYSLPGPGRSAFAARVYENIAGCIGGIPAAGSGAPAPWPSSRRDADHKIMAEASKSAWEKINILYLYAGNEISLAERRLEELQRRPCLSRLLSPFRYLHMVGFRPCLEHYAGKLLGKKEY